MSLFIGNVSKKVTHQQLEEAFKSFGNCKIDLRKRYAFIQYDSQRCAEQAKQSLQNVSFSGLRLNIQWSKNSGRFNQNKRSKNQRVRRRRSTSRDRSWKKQQKYYRRSPSFQRRPPSYSENDQELQTFTPSCPRDHQLYRRLKLKKQQKEKIEPKHPKQELEAGEAI